MVDRGKIGRKGEDLACNLLLEMGWKILARNWRVGRYEIDIVAECEQFIRFVEVRTLSYPSIMEPFETIKEEKRRRIIKSANSYVKRFNISKEVRFDIVSILVNGENHKIELIENAFTPLW